MDHLQDPRQAIVDPTSSGGGSRVSPSPLPVDAGAAGFDRSDNPSAPATSPTPTAAEEDVDSFAVDAEASSFQAGGRHLSSSGFCFWKHQGVAHSAHPLLRAGRWRLLRTDGAHRRKERLPGHYRSERIRVAYCSEIRRA